MKRTRILMLLLAILPILGHTQEWEKINTGFDYILKGIEFPDGQSQIGWAGGQSVTWMGDGIVLKTTNGGTTWSSLWTGADQGVEDICFTDMNTGYIGGWSGYFAKTTDGGLTWTPMTPGTDIYYYACIDFKDAQHGVVGAQTNSSTIPAAVYYTSDGGATWATGTGLTGIPVKVVYTTANTYFIVNNSGEIQKSTNGGQTWTSVKTGLGTLVGIDFYNPMIGIATADDGYLYLTFDGGNTWSNQQTGFGQPIWHDAAWMDQNTVYTCGTPEYIYMSTDGGSTWVDDYPINTWTQALYEVICNADGSTYICSSQGYFFRKVPPFSTGFAANSTSVCTGSSLQFNDQSVGTPSTWNWTFEGGNPATSNIQNPVVSYSTPGLYDVTLIISKGTVTDTLTKTEYITVEGPVTAAPSQPAGQTQLCGSLAFDYTTTSVPFATGYTWAIDPVSAGTFTGNGTTATLAAGNTYTGAFTIKVAGSNSCGAGPYSPVLNGFLSHQPVTYSLFSGGGFCAGQPGYDVKLEDSEIGVNYQLYKNAVASGTLVPGTGNELSFGPQTEGDYTVVATATSCTQSMLGTASVYAISSPAAPLIPTGPATVCNTLPTTFTASLPANGFTLHWTLDPPTAGTITQPATTTALVTWNTAFSGTASLSVQGENECGAGPASPALAVSVNAAPAPVIDGSSSVCTNQQTTYSVSNASGTSWNWTVNGGTLVSGQGSSQISVLWGAQGSGYVQVTETSAAGCAGLSNPKQVLINPCTGTDELTKSGFSVYPNPARDVIRVAVSSASNVVSEIILTNAQGAVVYSSGTFEHSGNTVKVIPADHLAPGIYQVSLISGSERKTARVVVAK
jgi:photosystem II stability/assembly factor-like uncharacterized protein